MKYLILIAGLFLASCGNHVKKIKSSSETNVSKETKIDSAGFEKTDKSTTKVTEFVDTTVKFKGFEVKDTSSLNEDSLQKITIEKDGVSVETIIDKKNKKLYTNLKKKEESVNVKVNKVTEVKNDKSEKYKSSSTTSTVDSSNKTVISAKNKHNYNGPNWTIIIISTIAIFAIGWYIFGKIPKIKINDRKT